MRLPSHSQPNGTYIKDSIEVTWNKDLRKLEDVLGEDQCGFRSVKGNKDAIWMLKIISERTFDTAKELCSCFIDCQMDWTKLMQILNVNGIDWRARTLISKLTYTWISVLK
jgi:hypothetical protein